MDNEHEIKINTIDFEEKLQLVKTELLAKIEATGANIESGFSEVHRFLILKPTWKEYSRSLLGNALKYRSSMRKPLIRIKSEHLSEYVVLSIEDNGQGIDLDEHGGNLFKPFKRFHQETEGMGRWPLCD